MILDRVHGYDEAFMGQEWCQVSLKRQVSVSCRHRNFCCLCGGSKELVDALAKLKYNMLFYNKVEATGCSEQD